jgi:hypothetical protein
MHFTFDAWRGTNVPLGWAVERFTEYTHLHGEVRPDGYALLCEGNLHLPLTPRVAELCLCVQFRVNAVVTQDCFDLSLVYGYDRVRRQGLAVRLEQRRGELLIAWGRQNGNRFLPQSLERGPALPLDAPCLQATLSVSADQCVVRVGDRAAMFATPAPALGYVALARGRHAGEVVIERVDLDSPQDWPATVVLPRTVLPLPGHLHAHDSPIRCSVAVTRLDEVYEVEAELSGGVADKTYDHPGNYHARLIDWLTRPYIRLGNDREQTPDLSLCDDTIVLCAKPLPNRFFYNLLYREPAWPMRVRFFLDRCPADPWLIVGHHGYLRNTAQSRRRGPTEMRVEPGTGRVLAWGSPLASKQAQVWVESPASPALMARLPADEPRRDQALAYVRDNHYFVHGEDCRFTVLADHAADLDASDLTIQVSLEDAFFTPRGAEHTVSMQTTDRPGMHRVAAASVSFGRSLAVGVYHLRCSLRWGAQSVERVLALEIMPASADAPPAPLASGLPVFMSMPNETRGLQSDAFDPWEGDSDDVAHYLSVCCYLPDFAERQRIWDVVHAYGRRWFAYICTRTTDRPRWQDHLDAVAHCDYLFTPDDPKREGLRYYVARPQMYRGYLLDALRRFVTDQGVDFVVPPGDVLPIESFRDLLSRHWHAWLDYFNADYRRRVLDPLREQLHRHNPDLQHASYGPIQTYFGHYRGTYQLRHLGLGDPTNADVLGDGFMLLEDYPIASGYTLSRGPYQLASCKLALPRVRVYPELYPAGVQGCPDGAVLYAWPPAGMSHVPAITLRKRAFEYAFAAMWFDAGRFHAWRDDGFHACKWTRERYEVMLRAWSVVRAHRPVRPLRTAAFVQSEACCRAHGSRLSDGDKPSVFNTTEEAPAWAYEMAREAGLAAGFTLQLESVADLQPGDVHTLVLPPLYAITDDQRAAIRRLHEQGVSLLAFEVVPGLEDLFGVTPARDPFAPLRHLRVNTTLADNPLLPLADLTEYSDTVDHAPRYASAGASVLLEGEAPVLFMHQTKWGRTALYNLPPTMVRRDTLDTRYADGAHSLSALINGSCRAVLRALAGAQVVQTSAGKLIAFRDESGATVVAVEEDAWPDTPRAINPRVRIRLPGVEARHIHCDRPMAIHASSKPGDVSVDLSLGEHECAVLVIDG